MKKIVIKNERLTLKKETIVRLNSKQLTEVFGGKGHEGQPTTTSKQTETCPPSVWNCPGFTMESC